MQIDRPISIAIILFITLLLSFYLMVPKYKELKVLQLDLAQKEAEYNAQFAYYSEITNKFKDVQLHKDDLQKISDALPPSVTFGQLAYYFQKQSKDNGLILKSISLSQASTGNIKDIIFSLNLSGDYLSLENFIVSLERSARLFEVSTVSFGLSGTPSAQGASNQTNAEQTETEAEAKATKKEATPVQTPASQFENQQIFNFSLEVKTHSY